MAITLTMANLTVDESTNSPLGSDSVTPTTGPDDYIRNIYALIRREQAQATNTASAATVDLGAIATGSYVHITGTNTTITSFGTVAAGISRVLVFDGALTLTHNATSLILPGGANITTAAGDVAEFVSEGSGNWRCTAYLHAAGLVTASSTTTLTNKTINLASNTLTGTKAQFDTACSDDNFAYLGQANSFSGGNQLITGAYIYGYGTGAGGTVTQSTSKSTGVTLNKPNGVITMHNAALAAGATATFILNNSFLATGIDKFNINVSSNFGTSRKYTVEACPGLGGVYIHVTNVSGGSLSEAVDLYFGLYQGSNS